MIIDRVWAENVLKYALLELDDIPEQGLIAVVGDNESGKSSIGESICFALFGRTFSLEPKDLDKVIRWGESRCSIKLDFTTPEGQGYQVARFLDELGNHGASLSRRGEEPMVRGVDEVEASLASIIGFGYTEFIESFYLAQREITTPHPHSFAVKAMAGVDVLQKMVATCQAEAGRVAEELLEVGKQRQDIESQIALLALRPGQLESLEQERDVEDSTLKQVRQRIADLKLISDDGERVGNLSTERGNAWLALTADASFNERKAGCEGLDQLIRELEPLCANDERTAVACGELGSFATECRERLAAFDGLRTAAGTYRDRLLGLLGRSSGAEGDQDEPSFTKRRENLKEQQRDTKSRRRSARVLMVIFLLLGGVAWCGWGMPGLSPDTLVGNKLSEWLPPAPWHEWLALYRPWVAGAAGLLSVLFFIFLGRGVGLSSKLEKNQLAAEALGAEERAARQEAEDIARIDSIPLAQAVSLLSGLSEESIASQALRFATGAGAAQLDPKEQAASREAFERILMQLKTGITRIKTDSALVIESLHESITEHATTIARLDEVIREERERVRQHRELSGISRALGARAAEYEHRIRVRELAIDLLNGAIHYISQRFNTEVRNLAADTLPRFTNGRYEHLQIDENLRVKAFSNEKRNFMDLDEISSGTQRQIMLAVRLALSQKLVNSVIQGPQMIFLDEPFAFFDEGRTASALSVLPQVSPDFTQIWVTSQTFPAKSHFDMQIECNAEENRSPLVWHNDPTVE